MAGKLRLGSRVVVKNTMLYNGRVGTLQRPSNDPEDPWDYNVLLEPAPIPEGTSRISEKLYGERTIGVHASQVSPL